MNTLLKEFENMGFKVEVGYREKNRKKNIFSSLRKLKETGDDVKINYVKTLYRYYCTINSLGHILYPKDIRLRLLDLNISSNALLTVSVFLLLRGFIQPYLLNTSITVIRYLIPLFHLLNFCISTKSAAQISSIPFEITDLF